MPELPPRDQEACNQEKLMGSAVSADLGLSQDVFEPGISPSDTESDNENLSEEVVPVFTLLHFYNRLTWIT